MLSLLLPCILLQVDATLSTLLLCAFVLPLLTSSSSSPLCRLITSGTLEEKIMSLQKFKLSIANTVISAENSSLTTMGTDQLLNLFSLEKVSNKDDSSSGSNKLTTGTGKGIKSVLESLPELCDESSYETEYDLSNFIQSLH